MKKHGAIPRPDHPATQHAQTPASVLVGARQPALLTPNWFEAWEWPATRNALGNDDLSNCVEAADVVLLQGWAASQGLVAVTGVDATTLAEARYQQIAGWDGLFPGNDPGSVTEVDAFAWQAVPIVAGGWSWPAKWAIVPPGEVLDALAFWPLLLTIGLCAHDEDDPDLWESEMSGEFTEYHRVVAGAIDGKWLTCRTYGFDVPVNVARIVGVDMMVPVSTPEMITAGVDWRAA